MSNSFILPAGEKELDLIGGEVLAGSGFEVEEPDPAFIETEIPEFFGGKG